MTCQDCKHWRSMPHSIYEPDSWTVRPYCHAPERFSWYGKMYTVETHPACEYFQPKGA